MSLLAVCRFQKRWCGLFPCLTTPCVIAGIEPHGNKVLQPAVFTVDTLEAGSGEVLVYVEDPEGHTEEVSITQRCPPSLTTLVLARTGSISSFI